MNIKINTGRKPGRLPKPIIFLITVLFFAVGILLIVRTVHNSTHLTAETTAVITDIKIEESVRHDSNKSKALIEVNSKGRDNPRNSLHHRRTYRRIHFLKVLSGGKP